MSHLSTPIFVGHTAQAQSEQQTEGQFVTFLDDAFYKITNFDAIEPFFMSIVSSSNHWLFISSTGGLSAGRVSAEQALFPYYTDDKLAENSESTGSKSIFLVTRGEKTSLWEPFSARQKAIYDTERNIYKNTAGTAIVLEENNRSLGLCFRYAWRTSDAFGFVKTSWLQNTSESDCQVRLLDGLQNILPANVSSQTQNTFSCLLDAYKRAELDAASGLAIFSLSSTLTDLAEPSESLMATTAFQLGLDEATYLLSSVQLDRFRAGMRIVPEQDVRGRRGAYFVHATVGLAAGAERTWHLIAEVSQDSAAVVNLSEYLRNKQSDLTRHMQRDIEANNTAVKRLVAGADGLQVSNNQLYSAHHFANVMFNCMRGGTFQDQYRIDKDDFLAFVTARNHGMRERHPGFFADLPENPDVAVLLARSEDAGPADLTRLCHSYLPLSFSRRHGDPSRPWNRFSINIKNADGSKRLGYEGNWRDIFQNWEALAYSYPSYIESMISTFLNATTFDGYNPYRISHQGVDWETPEPSNPWANIGYWSDHQIIYLLKLMEVSCKFHPGKLRSLLARQIFSYANVPYRIKPYRDLLRDSTSTIDFDWDAERVIETRVKENGADGKLVFGPAGDVLHVTLADKLLTLLLAKLANFVPEAGIWMNTQRPEWNDANNALVGKGVSVVTLCHLRRYIAFCIELLGHDNHETVTVSSEVHGLFSRMFGTLTDFTNDLNGGFSDVRRRAMLDALGQAGSDYRWNFYLRGVSGESTLLPVTELAAFLRLALQFVEQSLRANKRTDGLYHAYNVLRLEGDRAAIGFLYEMLEGQVAALASGLLTPEESLALLQSMRHSALFQPSENSYILYPDRNLPGFLEKNVMPADQAGGIVLFSQLAQAQDKTLIARDAKGNFHFSGHIRNAKDVAARLAMLKRHPQFAVAAAAEEDKILALFERVFRHAEFTGRSGTFFAYEGLGSVYWHMVSKLLLAVQETVLQAKAAPTASALIERYVDVRMGLGFNKSPGAYGAFPTDPYSHTPKGRGAKQPGMTGMVKEEILTRQVELGMLINEGRLIFDFVLLDRSELLAAPGAYEYVSVDGQQLKLALDTGSMAYSLCQVPIMLQAADHASIHVHLSDGRSQRIEGHVLDLDNSRHIFQRDGVVHHLHVFVPVQGSR